MEDSWFEVIDREGVAAKGRHALDDPSSLEVELPTGERLFIARALVHPTPAHPHVFQRSFRASLSEVAGGQVAVPVFDEYLDVSKRRAVRERLRLNTTVSTRDEHIDVPLLEEEISIQRVPVGRVVQQATGARQEGDTLIVPVYEETIVVEKRLILKEEVHVTRTRRERHEQQEIALRRENLVVERVPLHDSER